jgi:hypothetical protein
MKNQSRLLFFFFFFALQIDMYSQKKEMIESDQMFQKYRSSSITNYTSEQSYYICSARTELQKLPVNKVVRHLTDNVGVIEIANKHTFDSLSQFLNLAPANHTWKLSPQVENNSSRKTTQTFIITGQDIDQLLQALPAKSKGFTVVMVNRPTHSIVVRSNLNYIKSNLLSLHEVIFVDLYTNANPEANIIGYNRSFHGINAIDFLLPGANGKNIVAGVKEQKMDENDIDLWKRVLPSPLAAPTISQHATVIASIIGGAGNSSYQGKGIAPGCLFFPSSFSNLFADDEAILRANKVTVQNHSYGTIIQQHYGAEALSYDQLTWNNKTYIPVFASGNQGESAATTGQYANIAGFANLTGNFKIAKNIIAVGAIDNKGNLSPQSSSGPAYDGRLAPHLIALGPNGTSDAAAVVSGTIAVMQQVYADSNSGAMPPSSLIKAILFNTAEDIYTPGIDFKTGYGLLDSYAAVRSVQQKKFDGGFITSGQEWTRTMNLPAGIHSLHVTLAWTDSTATLNNNKAITNDLDLEVVDVTSGTTYLPWRLNTSPQKDSLEKLPIRSRDSLNTAEQVTIPLPSAGNYLIKVRGTQLTNSPLPFHIAFKTDTLHTFSFTSPLHASDVESGGVEPVTIRWKTFLADTNQTGNLSISYDSGTTWTSIAQSLKLIRGQHAWQGKDTNAIAMLKMETPFGQFLSGSFILSQPTRINLDFNCTDSFRLSWNRHINAEAYRIYTLTDNPYLEPALAVKDTFAVLQKSSFPSRVYAVEPILNNGLSAARSGAMDLNLQGVQCYYRTIYYNLLDNNRIQTTLLLSTYASVDSIFFENVSANGQVVQTYGRSKAAAANLLYTSVLETAPAGITYIRGRIKLENGAVFYTEIVPVLTSGTKKIWFYPVPARKSEPVRYVLQQGVPASSSLQLFDANGKLVRSYAELPNQLDVSGLPAGLIIYKLFDGEKMVIETGKLILQ